MATDLETGGEERGSASGRRGATTGVTLTGRGGGMGLATDEGALGSITGGEQATDWFRGRGEGSITRGGAASGAIASSAAGAGHRARTGEAMGTEGGTDVGKITGSTAAGAGGGGATTGL